MKRFQDVYRRISNVREFVVNEGKRINGTLLAFQNKYENQLSEIDTRHQQQHEDLVKKTGENFDRVAAEHERLAKEIEVERLERIKQNEESFNKILSRVQGKFKVKQMFRRLSTRKPKRGRLGTLN